MQVGRLTIKERNQGLLLKDSFILAASNVFSKFPQMLGLIVFYKNVLLSKKAKLIEYK
jgi:hypothetical protein